MRQSQANKVSAFSSRSYGFDSLRRPEEDLYEQEKARFERMKKDEEFFALKKLQNERVKQVFVSYITNYYCHLDKTRNFKYPSRSNTK